MRVDESEKPNLSLGDLAYITEQRYQADQAAWEVLRPLLKPKKWDETTRFNGPRPPKRASEFYLILSNYSTEVFFIEANRYPRYPPNPHSRNWLVNLTQRTEDHVIKVVEDIEGVDPEKDFSYHGVTQDEMRNTIRHRLEKEMKDHFPTEFPRVSAPPLRPPRKPTPDELRRIGIDPANMSPLLHEVIEQQTNVAVSSASPPKTPSFGEELDRFLNEARKSAEWIAEKIGVDPTTVYRHKSGKLSPTRTRVGEYERVLSGVLGYDVKLPTPARRRGKRKRQ